jgi:hypothetical protein
MAITTYLVTNKETNVQVFVKAASKQTAIALVTTDKFTVQVASKDNLTDLLPMGIKIIDPSKPAKNLDAGQGFQPNPDA